ncbi:OFA family MFS transporter [Thiomonas sp. FB-6]|uniref:OFA family MFS transporter n=1 Tax=Thiomonas sp. FB-6 TaxID=1158291 RepID=UPI0005718528|nr:OFA family MFS transporter [Thiomonas sp. FB-6]
MSEAMTQTLAAPGLLDRARIVAGPRFNRWLVPPAALAIHLCIGMAYGFSVFWLPMSKLLSGSDATCQAAGLGTLMFSTSCNWSVPMVTSTFEMFIAVLGLAAALWGGWLEHAGPRKAGFIAALCWGGGMVLGGIGVSMHQLWLLWLGCGIIGGVGQGLGYITPVSTLIKWFPDRRGMATGMAIMGYGGGAMIGAPIAVALMKHYGAGNASAGVSATLITMGILYLIVMSLGAFGMRVPPSGWKPEGWTEPTKAKAMVTSKHVHLDTAWKTPQFWLIWGVLFLNVTAGIGVISMASPMLQDVFGGHLIGLDATTALSTAQKAAIVASAAGLVGLISLFNSLGRFFWASISDHIGRKTTYYLFFIIGIVMYLSLPVLGHHAMAAAFVVAICIILSMYGGGFSTVPAYLADIFGTQMVGAIHGRLLTAWSAAGIVGPFLIAHIRQAQINAGVAHNLVYDGTLHILAGLLLVGLILNSLVRPVHEKHHMDEARLAREKSLQHEQQGADGAHSAARGSFGTLGLVSWLAIGIPFLIGVYIALTKAAALF